MYKHFLFLFVAAFGFAACDGPLGHQELMGPQVEQDPAGKSTSVFTDSASDRSALVALYQATDGANWTNSTNWLSEAPIGQWYGITTNHNHRVIELRLVFNGLNGEIPAELGSLSELERLWLFNNRLIGGIPPELGSLANLRDLWLYNNRLEGQIPPTLGNLSSLESLRLSHNQLAGEIPSELRHLINLKWLSLGGSNQLAGCKPESWRDIPESDLADLGLPYCGDGDPGSGVPLFSPSNGRFSWERSTIILRWDPVVGATYYNIYYDDYIDSECSLSSLGQPLFCEELATHVRETSYVHTTPYRNENYNYYWITACNSHGCSDINSKNPAESIDEKSLGLRPVTVGLPSMMYWTNRQKGAIQRANIDGSFQTIVSGLNGLKALALDGSGGKMYWTDRDGIQRANIDGSQVQTIVSGLRFNDPRALALDESEGKIYWAGLDGIQQANIDGSQVQTIIADCGFGVCEALALDGSEGKIYWTSWDGIQQANIDGSQVQTIIADCGLCQALALDGSEGKIYWTDWDGIRQANIDGSQVQTIIADCGLCQALALDESEGKIYWTGLDGIQQANIDGSQVQTIIRVDPPYAIALCSHGCSDINSKNPAESIDEKSLGPRPVTVEMPSMMYWTNPQKGAIQRANTDGSQVQTIIADCGLGLCRALALDESEGKIYWTDWDGIQQANIDGSQVQTIVSGLNAPMALALDESEGKIYWANRDEIQRANTDGSQVQTIVSGSNPMALALDESEGKIYWTDLDGIRQANIDGSQVQRIVSDCGGLGLCRALALDESEGKIYWTNWDGIQQANIDGSQIQTIIADCGHCKALALDESEGKIYWTDWDGIRQANIDGSQVQTIIRVDPPYAIALSP